jgi:hypothetical protein
MRNYLITYAIVLVAGCANNWLNLKQSEMLLLDEDPTKVVYRKRVDLPIAVQYTSYNEDTLDAYKRAINIINKQAGCEIFKQPEYVDAISPKSIDLRCWNRVAENTFIGFDEPNEELGMCTNELNEDNTISSSVVYIPCYRPFPQEQEIVALHEMMHTLGFGHDRDLGTVMYHSYVHTNKKFTEEDTNILRNYFCGNQTMEDTLNEDRD